MLQIVIIGGVAGGMSAATRARRMNEHASITVLERGGFISFANCGLPYYLAGRITDEAKLLVTTPERVRQRFNIDARVRQEVKRIDPDEKEVEVFDRDTGQTYTLPYHKLILAPGATPVVPPIDHIRAPNVFLLRSMEDAQRLQRWLAERRPAAAVVVGAGFIGLEMAEALRERGLAVTVIEKAPHALPPLDPEMAVPVAEELAANGVRLIAGTGLKALHPRANDDGTDGDLVGRVETEDGTLIHADLVLLSVGVRPDVGLAADAGLRLGHTGAIAVDAHQRTSDRDIYAVGDACETAHGVTGLAARVPLAGPANRQGRLAGEHAATGTSPPADKVFGTAIVRVFGLSVGVTGLNEQAAWHAGYAADVAYVTAPHHASYYPGAKPLRIKLVYEPPSRRVLGAQVVGAEGVDKRIDVIATAMHFNGTIDDLASLDLAYAPQFSSAKDPVHLVAMVAQNQRRLLMPAVAPAELDGDLLLDVRSPAEFASGTLDGAVNVPLDELRQRLDELDPARPTVTFCQVGQRGYVAQRILSQYAFENVRNLKGGLGLATAAGRPTVAAASIPEPAPGEARPPAIPAGPAAVSEVAS
jgi:NADPH-dependent 2,4-dienoyl-CoA reductase/sulfur reductase-like enzyme/rhodanese-related sulfurtransferase